MADGSPITVLGKVVAVLPGTLFRIELQNGHTVLGNVSGKLRKQFVRMDVGDRVKIEMVPYDLEKGRIVARLRDPNEQRPPYNPQNKRR